MNPIGLGPAEIKRNIGQRIEGWAEATPCHLLLAQRDEARKWQTSYGDIWERGAGKALLAMEIGVDTRLNSRRRTRAARQSK